jgi:tetratricopeptide (TPR) repeat protein
MLAQRVPDDVTVQVDLADVLFKRGRLREATRAILQVARRLPRDGFLILGVAKRLMALGEIVAARACLDLLAQAPAPPPSLLAAQAHLRFSIGEIAAARVLMDRAIAAGMNSPGELQLHAMLLQFSGDIEGAQKVLEGCLQRWPQFGDAIMALVNLRKQEAGTHRLDFVQGQLRQLSSETGDPGALFVRAEFEYAQFKILDDLGRHDEAWPALARCNTIMHELNPYDSTGEAAITEELMRMPPREARPAAAPSGPTPIFIVGMPRSGTTLLDRMLSRHSAVTSAGEIVDFWRQLHWVADVSPSKSRELLQVIQRSGELDYALLGARYLRQTQWRAEGRAYYIDKLPANIQMVGFIRRALPHAPILHMVRDPVDTCFSNLKSMFGNISPYSYDQESLAQHYAQYARLARHWHNLYPGVMLDVSYASLVGDPMGTLSRVLGHCGLAMEEDCLRPELNSSPVATPSSVQVREAVHSRGMGQWRNYEAHLRPLCQALDARLGGLV